MSNRLITMALSKPLWIYGILLLVTLISASLMVNIKIDTDPENMLSKDEPARVFHNQVKKEFLLNDLIVVGVKTIKHETIYNPQSLSDLKKLTDSILAIEGVNHADVNALSTIDNIEQIDPGTIRFEWMMSKSPKTQQDAVELSNKAKRLPFVVNSLVSGDEKAATIYVPIYDKNESYRISNDIQSVIKTLSDQNQYYLTGLPVAEDTFGYQMFIQMGISAPTAAFVIYLLMLYFFRSATLVMAPMIVAMSTVIIIMGVMIGMGYTVHIMSSMIAIFLMPIAVVDSVHLMSEFVDKYVATDKTSDLDSQKKESTEQKSKKTIAEITRHLFQPMLFTSVTSAAGFFSLMLTPIPPVQIFGAFVGSGILLAFIITIVYIPAYISRMNESQLTKMHEKLHKDGQSKSILAKILPSWGRFSVKKSKLIIIMSVLLVLVSVVGISKIEVNDNPVRWFKPSHPIRVADKILNQHFAGTYDAHLVFEFTGKETLTSTWVNQINKIIHSDLLSPDSKQQITAFLQELPINNPFQEFVLLLDDLSFEETEQGSEFINKLIRLTEQTSVQARYFLQPDKLAYIESLQNYLKTTSRVGKSNSVVDLIKTVNRELRSGQETDYKIPNSSNAVSQTLLQFQSSHRQQDLWHFIIPDHSKTLVWLQMTSGDNKDMAKVIKDVNRFISENPLPHDLKINWAGKTYLNLIWQDKMVKGMFASLASAFVIVFIMMALLFRSIIFGLLAMLPLSITIVFMYGMIGWFGKYYDMPIAVLSALTLGLSVDFAIHFIERTRSIFKRTLSWELTIKQMFEEPARAISRNALVIALGFTPLLLAPLVPYITVGVFLASIMAVSALVTILLLPAIMNLLKNFLFKITQS